MFGLWGSSPDDMWAVGGADGGGTAVCLAPRGRSLARSAGVSGRMSGDDKALWKVWGSEEDNVWLVGSAGVAVH